MALLTENEEYEQECKDLFKSLSDWLKKNAGWKVGGVGKDISQDKKTFKEDIDLDIKFWIAEPYEKREVYKDLIPKLRKAFPESEVKSGPTGNVIKIFQNDLGAELDIIPEKIFIRGVNEDKFQHL